MPKVHFRHNWERLSSLKGAAPIDTGDGFEGGTTWRVGLRANLTGDPQFSESSDFGAYNPVHIVPSSYRFDYHFGHAPKGLKTKKNLDGYRQSDAAALAEYDEEILAVQHKANGKRRRLAALALKNPHVPLCFKPWIRAQLIHSMIRQEIILANYDMLVVMPWSPRASPLWVLIPLVWGWIPLAVVGPFLFLYTLLAGYPYWWVPGAFQHQIFETIFSVPVFLAAQLMCFALMPLDWILGRLRVPYCGPVAGDVGRKERRDGWMKEELKKGRNPELDPEAIDDEVERSMRRIASKMTKKLKKDFVFYKREVSKAIANPAGENWTESFVMMSIEIEADGEKTSESEYETSSDEDESDYDEDEEESGSGGDEGGAGEDDEDDVEAARKPRSPRRTSSQRRSGSPRATRKLTSVVPEEV